MISVLKSGDSKRLLHCRRCRRCRSARMTQATDVAKLANDIIPVQYYTDMRNGMT
jgi:hypothetical protein